MEYNPHKIAPIPDEILAFIKKQAAAPSKAPEPVTEAAPTLPPLDGLKLRKSRTRMMLHAYQHGSAEKGNQLVEYTEGAFTFYYRGTPIMGYSTVTGNITDINAVGYEDTPSTFNQRKQLVEAVKEFKNAVLGESI